MFMTPQACLEAGTEYPRYKLFVGFDVGKRFHAAHARTGSGRRVLALRVDNAEAAVVAFVARALEAAGCEPGACLVVVDQRRNIGTVVVRRALAAGCDVAYITGKREKRARELFPGVAKNDAKDAEVIAAGMPQSLLPVPREDDGLEGARRLRSQLAFSVRQSTQVCLVKHAFRKGTAVGILDQDKVTRRTACTAQGSGSWQSRPTSSST